MSGAPDSAGIRFPPPFLFVGFVALAFALDRGVAWRLTGPASPAATIRELLGTGVLLLGLLLDFSALFGFLRAGTNPLPFRPSSAFVAKGPYRISRNPMYLGMTLTTASLGLVLDIGWLLVAALAAFAAVDRWVVPREEAYLERRFGADYLDYKRRVRRWI